MKTFKIILTVLCIFVFSKIGAQHHKIGLSGGLGIFNVTKASFQERKSITGLNFGLNYQYKFDSKIFLESGFYFQQRGFTSTDDWHFPSGKSAYIATSSGSIPFISEYYTIPLLIGKSFGERLNFEPKIGLSLGKLVRSGLNFNDGFTNTTVHKYDLALQGGLGIVYLLTESMFIGFDILAQHSITDYVSDKPFEAKNDFHKGIYSNLTFKFRF